MQRCLEVGARLARPGEFTLRAFLNGRLDLSQAESVAQVRLLLPALRVQGSLCSDGRTMACLGSTHITVFLYMICVAAAH